MLISGTPNFVKIRLPVHQLLHVSRQADMLSISQIFFAAKAPQTNTATL